MPIQRREAVVKPVSAGWEWDKFEIVPKKKRMPTAGYLFGNLGDTEYTGYLDVGGRRWIIKATEAINGQGIDCLDVEFEPEWQTGFVNSFPRTGKGTFREYLHYPQIVSDVEDTFGWTYSFYHNKRDKPFGAHQRIAFEIQKLKC